MDEKSCGTQPDSTNDATVGTCADAGARTNAGDELTVATHQTPDDRVPETERRLSGGRLCAGCGASLEGRRPQARFCSDACRARTRREALVRDWLHLRAQIDRLVGVEKL